MIFHDEQAVGLALREERLRREQTQKDLEASSGIPDATISEIENCRAGASLSPSAAAYARALGYQLVRRKSYELVPLRVRRTRRQ